MCVSFLLAFWSPCFGKRELVFVLIVHLFVSYAHVNLCHFFSSSWCHGLAAASACGSFWTFLSTFFHMDLPWDVGMKICSNVPGQMSEMVSLSIFGKKTSKITFFGTKRPTTLKLGIQYRVLKYNRICSNNDTGLTLTIFMTSSNLFPNASAWVKAYTPYSHVFPK